MAAAAAAAAEQSSSAHRSGSGSAVPVVSIVRGSFDTMDSPQLTMESVEVSTNPGGDHAEEDVEMVVPQHQQHTTRAAPCTVEVDENDDTGDALSRRRQQRQQQPSTTTSAPNSGFSSISAQPTDQVLDLENRLDCSDSKALFRISLQQPQDGSSSDAPPLPPPPQRRMMYSRTSSLRQSASKLARPSFSRRPSMHETYDSEPLMRGEFLYYLYSFAILGTSLRLFMTRFFGQDCEHPGQVTDFMSPLTEKICVTSDGTTMQHGGALFSQLPANMLGSFIMGLVSSLDPVGGRPGSKLPWLHKDHPLQKHEGIHHAIKVGFCGSLTTFSTWNTQMVLMMDGTGTELGPQVVPAIFGYIIGLGCASWSFAMGGRVHEWIYDWSNGIKDSGQQQHPGKSVNGPGPDDDYDEEEQAPTSWDSDDSNVKCRHTAFSSTGGSVSSAAFEAAAEEERREKKAARKEKQAERVTMVTVLLHKVIPFFIAISLLVAYGVTVNEGNIQFYRELFACSILTPVGVHLRWKLAALNGRGIGSSRKFEWVPWGTFTGNIVAVIISVVFQALYMKHHKAGDTEYAYIIALLVGMKTGVAGSLSTVSSFVKEVHNLATLHPTHAKAHLYSGATIIIAMFMGLLFYSPIMRYT